MIPYVKALPIEMQRFTTLGDWLEISPGCFEIRISHMTNWKHEFLVLIHELTEWAICQAMGVSTEEADAFDAMWEREIEDEIQSIYKEAGFDLRCPYRRGHVWGCRMERLFCWLIQADWKEYCVACDNLIERYDAEKRNRAYA